MIAICIVVGCILFFSVSLYKTRSERQQAEKETSLVQELGYVDSQIWKMRINNPLRDIEHHPAYQRLLDRHEEIRAEIDHCRRKRKAIQ